MIVISGALVLVALVLLVIGIVGPELGFVYASIGVSLVSLVFLVIGILQRRGETLPATAGAPAPAPRVDTADTATAVIPSQGRAAAAAAAEPAPIADSADEELETGGTVLVVAGRPRYHVAGCRYLGGKDAEAIDVLDAREEGFTPCGVCKPDDALAALEAEEAELEDEQLDDGPVEEPALAPEEVEASTPTRVRAPARKAPAVREVPAEQPARASKAAKAVPGAAAVAAGGSVRTTRSPAKTPARKAPAKVVAPAVEPVVAPVKAARKAPAKAPSRAATLAADSTPAAATAKRTGTVVVIPDRGRFHRAECRYVRGVDGAEDLTRAAATRQGYEACGVCKP